MVVEALSFYVVLVAALVPVLVQLRRWWWMRSPGTGRNAADPITAMGVLLGGINRLIREVRELVETVRGLF